MKRIPITLALGAALLAPALAQVDAAKSSVIAVSKQMGVPVEGKFRRFSAQVSFDPAKPADGRASIEIDIASFDLGDADFNRETAKKEWFDAVKFPKATFVTTAIKPAGAGRFEAAGKLAIKGITRDVVAPVSFKAEGGQQVFEGMLPIKRLAFNIGEGEWKDTSTVADDVQIRFRIVTAKK
jgi:polyisoprenoid-binding protein YceI